MTDARAVAFYCPYCGEEDLEPDGDEGGRWHCHSCTRTFTVRQVRPRQPAEEPTPQASATPSEPTTGVTGAPGDLSANA